MYTLLKFDVAKLGHEARKRKKTASTAESIKQLIINGKQNRHLYNT